MGQGTDSCGGWEVEYDAYDSIESDNYTIWSGSDGSYTLSEMSNAHIRRCIFLCEKLSCNATFLDEQEKWNNWILNFEFELATRKTKSKTKSNTKSKQPVRGTKQKMKCHCGVTYTARLADIKRGWALSCSKRCAAIRRDYNKPKAKRIQ